MQLVFATNNENKVKEAKNILAPFFTILSLKDIACPLLLEETGQTLEENAYIKASLTWNYIKTSIDPSSNPIYATFADDTGLEIIVLNNEPGIHTARWAGENKDDKENIKKALAQLANNTNRKARFKTIINMVNDTTNVFFEGVLNGQISSEQRGYNGFGYDPIFIPTVDKTTHTSQLRTLAEMTKEEKNKISHRAKALQMLKNYLTLQTT